MANGAGFSMRVTGFCGLGQGTLAQCFASGSVEDIIQAPGDFCIAFEGHGETVPLTGAGGLHPARPRGGQRQPPRDDATSSAGEHAQIQVP
ncbi:MAG: hypothetical protein ACOY4L_11310 [Pseudomonadota bacterium]